MEKQKTLDRVFLLNLAKKSTILCVAQSTIYGAGSDAMTRH